MEKIYLKLGSREIKLSEIAEDPKQYELILFNGDKETSEVREKLEEKARVESRKVYKSILEKTYRNFSILSGAGTSIDGESLGKTMKQLLTIVIKEVTKGALEKFAQTIKFPFEDISNINLEDLLSQAENAKIFLSEDVDFTLTKIKSIIVRECTLQLGNRIVHPTLLSKIMKRNPSLPRAKVFTLNYDTLFEQAAEKIGAILIDGFSFSIKRRFNSALFDWDLVHREKTRLNSEESFIPRVVKFFKLHGSLSWEMEDSKIISKDPSSIKSPLIIYPNSSKFEQSYENPFFEMMSRFNGVLRKEDSILISVGFSFYDKHISNAIMEAVKRNPNFFLVVVKRTISNATKEIADLMNLSESHGNVLLLSESFADFVSNYPDNSSYTQINQFEDD